MSLASKYPPDELEKILARYEFLMDNCGEFKIEYEHGGCDNYYPGCTRSKFKKNVDSAIEFAKNPKEE